MNVWIRLFLAGSTALPADSISFSFARARPAMVGPATCSATSLVASNCVGDETGKPASIMSTPKFANCWAISSFSVIESEAPGDCSPSRKVVSKIMIFCFDI